MSLLSHLDRLEAEAIFILRETAAQFERPVLMFSGGKDSIILAHLAAKAFRPALSPFPYLHIDTGHNFPETLAFRDRFAAQMGAKLIVRLVEDSIRQGRAAEEKGKFPSRNRQQAVTLVDAIAELKLDACIGGGRRDEEKARAKERIFSVRDEFGGWEPLPNSPFSDAGFSLAVSQDKGVVNKSVSYFTNGTKWRVKVRAYKFKTEFEWSDWVEFTVDQN